MKIPKLLINLLLLGSAIAHSVSAEEYFHEQNLFEAGTLGYYHFRIPGIVITEKGTLITWCEARKEKGDWADIDIMVRRSKDGGETWGEPYVLVDGDDYDIPDADDITSKASSIWGETKGVTANNLVMIPDGDRIHIVFCLEYRRCFYAVSTDEGKTTSKPVDITDAFEPYRTEHGFKWKVIATGPGHGLKHSSGRLIVPSWLSTAEGENGHRPAIVGLICSDDHGKTWEAGDVVVRDKTPYVFGDFLQSYVNPNESMAIELADGSVMMNSRSESPENRRVVTTSTNGVTNWGKPRFDNDLWDPVCLASIIRLTKKPESDKNRILFTNPNSIDRPRRFHTTSQRRENVTIRLSYDEGQTWPVSKVIESGPSGYSDMAIGPDGMIYVLYEKGPGTKYLTLARMNLEWITDGQDSL